MKQMKNVEIHISITAGNGEWENRITKELKLDHSIGLELLNDENVFNTVMSLLKHRMSAGLDTTVNSVMQQMIDSENDDKNKDGSEDAGATESGNA